MRPRWLVFSAAISMLLLACQVQRADPRVERFAQLPNWNGIWISGEPIGVIDVSGYPNFNPLTDWKVAGVLAPLNESTRARITGVLQQPATFTQFKAPSWGFPLMMESPTALQFSITPEETVIMNFYRDVRHVYTDGRALPGEEDRWPGPWGESIGRWEGDTLVIETVGADSTGLTGLPFPVYSLDASYVERIRMVDADRVEAEITVTDPATLTAPYTFTVSYKRAPAMDRMFHMPFDNDRTTPGGDGLFTIAAPATP